METWTVVKRGDKCLSCVLSEQQRKLTHCSLSSWCVLSMCTKKHVCKQVRVLLWMRENFFSCLTKRLESLSSSWRKKGECNIFDSSEITSALSWHHDVDETALHLQPPPNSQNFKTHSVIHFTCSAECHSAKVRTKMCSDSHCAGATYVICPLHLSLELHHLGTFQTLLQQAGRVSFSSGDAPLPVLVFVISLIWMADLLCTGSSHAAIIRDEWDSPRDKPDDYRAA